MQALGKDPNKKPRYKEAGGGKSGGKGKPGGKSWGKSDEWAAASYEQPPNASYEQPAAPDFTAHVDPYVDTGHWGDNQQADSKAAEPAVSTPAPTQPTPPPGTKVIRIKA